LPLLLLGVFALSGVLQAETAWTNHVGQPGISGSTNGTGNAALFNTPKGVAIDTNGNLYVADSANQLIRKVSPAAVVMTLAGNGTAGSTDGTGTGAQFSSPGGVAVDLSSNVYVADTNNHAIRKVTAGGVVTTLAGDSTTSGSGDGNGTAAQFYHPGGVALDASGNIYVADSGNNLIRRVSPLGVVTTAAGSGSAGSADGTGTTAQFNSPKGVAVDSMGNIVIADTGSHTIRKMTPAGVVTTIAGQAGFSGSQDGATPLFNSPQGVATDAAGNIYVADTGNHTLRKISATGQTTTIGGSALVPGSAEGTTLARFTGPVGIAVDGYGNLRVSDANHRVSLGTAPLEVVTASPMASGTMGTSYSKAVAAMGGKPPYSWWLAAGTLPAGLTLNATTGVLAGMPTAGKTSNFTIRVTGSDLGSVTKSFQLTVVNPAAPVITSVLSATGYAGEAFTYQITASGGPILSYVATGLPTGLTSANGTISGNTTQTGTFPVTLSATNASATGSKTLLLKIYNTSAVANRLDEFPLPLNDNFASRVALAGTTSSAIGSNFDATTEASEPDFNMGASYRSVWWKWTPSVSANVTIDTAGSDFDTFLGVATGSAVNALVPVASNDDFGNTVQSSVTFPAVAGTEYQIKVDCSPGSGSEGMVSLQIVQDVRSVAVSETSGGSASGGGTFATGTPVTVSASANAGYKFTVWTEDGDTVSTDAAYSFVPEYDRVIVANFEALPVYQIALSATSGGSAVGSGGFVAGSQVTATATANNGFRFVRWTENGTSVSTNAVYIFTSASDRTLIANFEATLSALQTWRSAYLGTSENTGNAADVADPDGDGLANLIEYATGTLPASAASARAPQAGMPGNSLNITFYRIADPTLTYQVWASSNLADWGVSPIWSSTGAANTAGEVTVTDPLASQPRRFLRLKVLAP